MMSGLSPNSKSVLQSTYPTFIIVFLDKEDNLHLITYGLFYHIPMLIVPA